MDYLTGYTIKPYEITGLGAVLFTDGTNNAILPNQQQCEAYGYTYDRASGTCSAFRYNTNLDTSFSNINNRINGAGNTTLAGANTIEINGTNNRAAGNNNNCLMNGGNNEIANGVNNATVLGVNGTAKIDCEFVTSSSDDVGQYSIFFLSGTTTDASATVMFLNGDTAITTIPRIADMVYAYTIDVVAVRIGGASGSGAIGDRVFFKIEGLVLTATASETMTIVAQHGYILGMSAGTAYVGHDMQIKVTGIAAMDWVWGVTAKFYQMQLP